MTVTVNICLTDHLIHLLVSQLFSKVCHNVPQLGSRDETVSVSIEHLECFDEFLLSISVLHFSCHERQKFREVNSTVAIGIDLIDHVLQFCLSGVLAK